MVSRYEVDSTDKSNLCQVFQKDLCEMSEEPELTLEERAVIALNELAKTHPEAEDVIRDGANIPEWMGQPWLPQLTDPSDSQFADAIIKAEAWLATH